MCVARSGGIERGLVAATLTALSGSRLLTQACRDKGSSRPRAYLPICWTSQGLGADLGAFPQRSRRKSQQKAISCTYNLHAGTPPPPPPTPPLLITYILSVCLQQSVQPRTTTTTTVDPRVDRSARRQASSFVSFIDLLALAPHRISFDPRSWS
jgi:hypothetical protein